MHNKYTELTRAKMAAVVQITVEGYAGDEVKSILNPRLGDLIEWSGSGFFVDCPYGEGIIVTNTHVVKNARSIEIMSMLTSEETFKAELVSIVEDQEPDIAIIRLTDDELARFISMAAQPIPHLSLACAKDICRGAEVKAIGYPMGMTEPNITGGEITNFIAGDRYSAEKYVTDAAINPGNSGGPAIDQYGNVIGINTSIYKDSDNIGFITPCSFIQIILKNIFESESVSLADIGGFFQKNSPEIASQLNMPECTGLIVQHVEEGGFMHCAGIQEEDVILGINELLIDRHGIIQARDYFHRRNIHDEFKLFPLGEEVTITVWRNQQQLTIKAKTMTRTRRKLVSKPVISQRQFLDVWGLTIQPMSYEILESFNILDTVTFYQLVKYFDLDKERLVVTHIEKESPARKQDWGIGDVISEFNDSPIDDMQHLISLLKNASGTIKLKCELGTLGYFAADELSKEIALSDPAAYLK